jgi:hypothetical protein
MKEKADVTSPAALSHAATCSTPLGNISFVLTHGEGDFESTMRILDE